MNALDAYRDVLRELDKYESPTFTINDFNYFYNKAISQFVDSNYMRLDLLMKDSEDLAPFTSLNVARTINSSGLMDLPTDFRHLLSLKIRVRFKVNRGRYRQGSTYEFWAERAKSGQKGFRHKSAYGKPNFRRYYYEITSVGSGGTQQASLKILFDSDVVEFIGSNNANVDYIRQPATVTITSSVVYTDPLEFSAAGRNNIYFQINNVCKSIFLENIESARTPITMQESATQQ